MRLLVLWDIDGTLLHAGDPLHRKAFDLALADVCGVPATLDDVELAGRLDREIARAALRDHDVNVEVLLAPLLEAVGERFVELLAGASRLDAVLHGVPEALNAIDADHAVLTGNTRSVARRRLEAASLAHLLADGAYGDEAESRAELVPLARSRCGGHREAVIVGDTPRDIAAAEANGCRSVAVATGHYDVDELRAAGATVVLPDLTDLPATLAAVSGG
jgi:phosphoglycolate phosphatase